jgi:intracellular sulfur oxidation DsrE/DsrF family protein
MLVSFLEASVARRIPVSSVRHPAAHTEDHADASAPYHRFLRDHRGPRPADMTPGNDRPRLLLIGATGLGRGDEELGATILANFLKVLVATPRRPETIVCWNAAVTLLAADSPVVDLFRQLEGVGIKVIACKTCVEKFGLQGKLEAGEVSTMPVIADLLLQADVLTV